MSKQFLESIQKFTPFRVLHSVTPNTATERIIGNGQKHIVPGSVKKFEREREGARNGEWKKKNRVTIQCENGKHCFWPGSNTLEWRNKTEWWERKKERESGEKERERKWQGKKKAQHTNISVKKKIIKRAVGGACEELCKPGTEVECESAGWVRERMLWPLRLSFGLWSVASGNQIQIVRARKFCAPELWPELF